MTCTERRADPASPLGSIVHPDQIVDGSHVIHVNGVTHAQEYHYWC